MNKLFNRNFSLLFQGQLVSQIGNGLFFFALAIWVKNNTDSALLFSLFGVAGILPAVLVSPIAATMVDRWSRKKIIVISDLINSVVPLLLAFWAYQYPQQTEEIIALLFIKVIVGGVVSSFFTPAVQASIPELVPVSKLQQANGFVSSTRSVSLLVGQSLAGILFMAFGTPALFMITGLAYLLSSVSETFLKMKEDYRQTRLSNPTKVRDDMWEGVRLFKQNRGLVAATIAFSCYAFVTNFLTVGMIYHVEGQLAKPESWYAYMLASSGAGVLLGTYLATNRTLNKADRGEFVIGMYVLAACAILIMANTSNGVLAISMQVTRGIAFGVINTWMTTAVQLSSSNETRGRVTGLYNSVLFISMPVGLVLAGVLVDITNKNTQLLFSLSTVFIFVLVATLAMSKDFFKFMIYRAKLEGADNKKVEL